MRSLKKKEMKKKFNINFFIFYLWFFRVRNGIQWEQKKKKNFFRISFAIQNLVHTLNFFMYIISFCVFLAHSMESTLFGNMTKNAMWCNSMKKYYAMKQFEYNHKNVRNKKERKRISIYLYNKKLSLQF